MREGLVALLLLLHCHRAAPCGRAALTVAPEKLVSLTGAELIQGSYPHPLYNAAPSMALPVLLHTEAPSRRKVLRVMRWGMRAASGQAAPSRMNNIINARSETIASKPTFKPNLDKRRCVVPFDGWYEWTKDKVPHFVRHREGGRLVMLAGVYDEAGSHPTDKADTANQSFSIVTVEANANLLFLHHRMPAVLESQEAIDRWLSVGEVPFHECRGLLRPYAGSLDSFPVSRRVGNVRNNDPSCIEALKGRSEDSPPAGGKDGKVSKVRRSNSTGKPGRGPLDKYIARAAGKVGVGDAGKEGSST
uniref:Abasic site processing protein n=1 Tax=Hemiselmis andersenii TaxID=464988 RepID=A0A7S0XTK9_HEMAN|mmetsp:Transcript_2722/g.6094  ORF Transcript_2722/g.6094 Transcript_2722/m.6094 type:complete len:304 (+) Transcript_2722:161-1072(+)|eukprot:CAMPEP_0172050692 /NCGR_PEP_ID=MMETSP1043-20130122/2746_1 /TAXON_ID=464988 /ORGANISM="Hemiselmis andersenii, Strain CCMP441" /LENGTH=303 /DNA_ID=CAMNT_0012709767 /DNA_START=111 /DNA_END=1022 /DNA_ORIENTATION=+